MSDWIEKDGKRYYAEEYLKGANNTAKRRADEIERLEAENERLIEIIEEAFHYEGERSFSSWLEMNGYRLAKKQGE